MGKLFNGLPLYEGKINIDDNETGMVCLSLVDAPATDSLFVAFNKEKVLTYRVENEEQRKVFGLVMFADTPIYRRDESGYEYYIMYSKETIALMVEKYFKEGFQNNVDTNHNFNLEEGITLTQMFIKDTARGVNPIGFEDITEGSAFAEYHIENDEVWNAIKDGTYKGFSMAGCFIVDEVQKFNKVTKNKLQMKVEKVKTMLRKLLAQFGEVATDKGTILWAGDEDLKEGDDVYTIDAEGNEIAVEDGEYKTEDGKTITIQGGKVETIVDNKAEVEPEVEPEPEDKVEGAEEEPKEDEIANIRKEIDELYKLVDSILEKIGETRREADERFKKLEEQPAGKSAEETFSEIEKTDTKASKMRARGYKF
jgi:hypothetical protein